MPPSWFDHCLIFPGFQYLVGCLLIGTKTYHIQIWNLTGNPVLLHVHRKYLHCKIKLCSDKMPSSNPLAFLRPLYDIAVWQFLLMSGQKSKRLRTGQPDHVKFTFGMHKVVANFICKLLEFQAFNHLKQKILETEAKQATGNWSVGEQATDQMIHWCQVICRWKCPQQGHWCPMKKFTNQRLEIILMMVTLLMKKTFQTTNWNSESEKHRSYECV